MALHVRDLGAGRPVVLLHPGPGLDVAIEGACHFPFAEAPGRYRSALVDWLETS